jgi:hypothetical protein
MALIGSVSIAAARARRTCGAVGRLVEQALQGRGAHRRVFVGQQPRQRVGPHMIEPGHALM